MLLGGLRRLSIPSSVLSTFLELARPQTNRKIETCALLLGTQRERFGSSAVQELVVEVLLVPKQKGTSDTCQMEQEEMVVEVQLERGLIALGWVSLGSY
jgi:STAM-binding protein